MAEATRAAPARVRSLFRRRGNPWHHHEFLKLWAGQSISEFGTQISHFAIPLIAAISLHASPFEFSLLELCLFVPYIVFALPAGVWVDRWLRRPVLLACDGGRATVVAAVPVLWALNALRMWELLVASAISGIFSVFFDVAYQSYLPSLLDDRDLVDGNAKLQTTLAIAQIGGPSAGGALVALLTAPYAVVADAASYIVSTMLVWRMRHREPPRVASEAHATSIWREGREGVGWLARQPVLRALTATSATINFFSTVLFATLLLYVTRVIDMRPVMLGLVFSLGGIGSIAGALAARRLPERIGVGRTLLAAAGTVAVGLVLFPLAPKPFAFPIFAAGQGFSVLALLPLAFFMSVSVRRSRHTSCRGGSTLRPGG